jgi:hypothetical protein
VFYNYFPFLVWITFVVVIGITFLVWAWKQGEFQITAWPDPRARVSQAPRSGGQGSTARTGLPYMATHPSGPVDRNDKNGTISLQWR